VRYILYQVVGEPPAERPVGMNDIVGIGNYMNAERAMRYLFDKRREYKLVGGRKATHLGLYEVPEDYAKPDVLVLTKQL
jgi:hypothetical protein